MHGHTTISESKAGRVHEIDGLRGIAVLAVLLWHFVGSMTDSTIVQLLTIWGRTGVDLFFVLSGFLIIGILVDVQNKKGWSRIFYWRRLLRIYPPYIALILAYWLCYAWVGETAGFNTNTGLVTQLAAQLTFTWNWLMALTESAVSRGFSVTWSVAIEEWFYLLAPWVLVVTPRRHLVALLLSIGVVSIALRALAWLWLGSAYSLAPYILPPFRLDGLCAGGLLALAVRNPETSNFLRARATVIAKAALAFTIATPLLIAGMKSNLESNMYLWGHTYLTVAYTVVLLWTVQSAGTSKARLLRAWPLREAGRYSYTLYLFHPLFISLFFTLKGETRELVNSWATFGLALAALLCSLGFSVLFYWVIERWAVSLGHRSRYNDA